MAVFVALVAATGCATQPPPSTNATVTQTVRDSPQVTPSATRAATPSGTDGDPVLAELPAMLLWQITDDATRVDRTGDPGTATELSLPPGWAYEPAVDGDDVVASRPDGSVAFGIVGDQEIELATPLDRRAPGAIAARASCVAKDGPAAFVRGDGNGFLVALRDGGWASVDALGALGDCAWLDREHLLVAYEGPTDAIRIHGVTAGPTREAGFGGRSATVSGGLIVLLDRTDEPNVIVVLDATGVAAGGAARERGRFAPTEPGTRYVGGVASPDGRWLVIVGDRELASGELEPRLWAIDLDDADPRPVPVPLPSGVGVVTDVTWPEP